MSDEPTLEVVGGDVRVSHAGAKAGQLPLEALVRALDYAGDTRASCGVLHSNRTAGDDNEFALASLAARPVARPAFPLEPLGARQKRLDPLDDKLTSKCDKFLDRISG